MSQRKIREAKKYKKTEDFLERCSFNVETNNLISIKMLQLIFKNFSDKIVQRLNKTLKAISFFIGEDERTRANKGIFRDKTYTYDFKTSTLTFYLSQIFKLGYESWTSLKHGSLKRYIWESFFHEIIMSLMYIIRINLSKLKEAAEFYFNPRSKRSRNYSLQIFGYKGDDLPSVNYFMLMTQLWNEDLPPLGFFNVLYNAKVDELKSKKGQALANISVIRVLNELRRNELNYDYEYNLSELVNYVLDKDRFKIFYRHDKSNKNNLYAKARRIILKFIKEYDIEFTVYKDSANRTYYFLTHKVFEKIKSACYQLCLQKVNKKAMEEYEKFSEFYAQCPICNENNINRRLCDLFYFSPKYSYFKDVLIEKMNHISSFEDLNDNREYFGVPCDDCFSITKNIQGKYNELNEIQQFIFKFGRCPICNAKNHPTYLSSFYYNESKKDLRDYLIQNLNRSENRGFKIHIGIPCCICYKNTFGEEPPAYNP